MVDASDGKKIEALAVPEESTGVALTMQTLDGFKALQRAAKCLCQSSLVPDIYQGDKGLPNAVIALEMANRMGANPLMTMQNLYVVHGRPAWSSQFLIATVNSSGRFTALRYEVTPPDAMATNKAYACRAWAIERATGERLCGSWINWDMVNAEGWASKNGSKWKSLPEQMFKYRAAAFWTRSYAPEIGMGLHTAEEVEDMVIDMPTQAEAPPTTRTESLRASLNTGKPKRVDVTPPAFEPMTPPAAPKPPADPYPPAVLADLIAKARELKIAITDSLTGGQPIERIDTWDAIARAFAYDALTTAINEAYKQ
jgi:hypothetical protein